MKRLFLGSFLAALAVFLFGAAYWIPVTKMILGAPTQPEAFTKSLADHLPNTGVYRIPLATGTAEEQDAASRKGPLAIVHFQREGMPAMDPAHMFRGFLVIWVTMALLALLLQVTAPALPTYSSRLLVVVVAGLIVASNSDLGATVWWLHSAPFAAASGLYNVISFTIGGAVLAWFIRRSN